MKQTYNYFGPVLLLLFFSIASNAQSTMEWGWAKSIGSNGVERPSAIATDSRNGVYFLGHFSGNITVGSQLVTSAGGADMYLIKYDTSGNLIWLKRFGGTGNDVAMDLKTDRSGNLVLSGYFDGTVNFGSTTLTSTGAASDVCIVKLRPDGTELWAKQFTGIAADYGGPLMCDDERNIYTAGTYTSNDFTIQGSSFTAPKASNVFYCKLDSNGNKIWAKATSSNTPFSLYDFDVVQPNTLLMYGNMSDNAGGDYVNFNPPSFGGMLNYFRAIFTVKTDTAGNFISQSISAFGGRGNGGGAALRNGKEVVKAGSTTGLNAPLGADIVTYDTNNNALRSQSVCGCTPKQSGLYDVAIGKNGNIYSVGFTAGDINWGGAQVTTSNAAFMLWEVDSMLATKGTLTTSGQTNFSQYLMKIAVDTSTGRLYTAGFFSSLFPTGTFSVGNNTLPYYGAEDVFIGQVKPLPTPLRAYAGNDTTLCSGSGVPIGRPTGATGGTPPYSYSWLPSTGLATPTAASTLATPTANTTYELTVTDALGNTSRDTIVVNIAQAPTATAAISAIDSTVCQGDSAMLITTNAGTLSYNWYKDAVFIANTTIPSYKTTQAGSYTLRLKDNATGCPGPVSQPLVVIVKPLPAAPTITTSGSGSSCQGSSVVLTSNTQNNYLWSNGATTQSITVTSSGSFTISTTGANGCKSPLSAPAVVAIGLRPNLGADTVVYLTCYGDMANLLPLYNTTGFTATWNTATPTAAPPGNYRLIASSVPGCADTAFADIKLEVAHWTGNVNSDWHTAGNWTINKVPTAFTHVIISFVSTGDSPVIGTANAVVASLQLRNGATLSTANGMTVTIAGNCAVLPPN